MKHLYQMKEVLDSWSRCMEKEILRTTTSPAICLEKNAQLARMKECVLLPIYEECLEKIKDLITTEYLFLLVDSDGILLKKTVRLRIKCMRLTLKKACLLLKRASEPMQLLFQ